METRVSLRYFVGYCRSNLVYNKDFTFYKYRKTKEFATKRLTSKQNVLIEFKDILELFHHSTEEIKPNDEDQKKDKTLKK